MAIRNIAVLILYNDQKQFLLQHRSKDAPRLPNHWGFFGGGIEEGETPEQALARELIEEIEYEVDAPQFVFAQKFMYGEDENTKYVFVEKYDPRKDLIQHEGQGMGWWKLEDLDNLLVIPHDQTALSTVKKFLGE